MKVNTSAMAGSLNSKPLFPFLHLKPERAQIAHEVRHGGRGSTIARYRRMVRVVLPITALLLGAFQAIVNRQYMNPDGISYLDMGDAIVTGDWHIGINGYWSPLYPLALGLANRITHPSDYWQFQVVHVVNFVIYVAALSSFMYFWRGLMSNTLKRANAAAGEREAALRLLGYGLFVWCSLTLITLAVVSPDLGVAAVVFLGAGLLVRIHTQGPTWRHYGLLGLVLGVGYLTKTIMFVLGFVFLACALRGRESIPKLGLATAVFLIASVPWIVAISESKARLTFGDSGRLNYAWFSDDESGRADKISFKVALGSRLRHAPQRVFDDPPVYEYAGPIKASYPFWCDASYWLDGVKPHFSFRQQIRMVTYNTMTWLVRSKQQYWAAFSVLLLMVNYRNPGALRRLVLRGAFAKWYLLLIGASAIALYCMVTFQNRYVAPFAVLLWAAIFLGITRGRVRTLLLPVALTLALVMTISVVVYTGLEFWQLEREGQFATTNVNLQVARELRRIGIKQGEKVASVGQTFEAYWARLARVTVISEIPIADAHRFWEAPPETQERIIRVFARTGARAIVADNIPMPHPPSGWLQVGRTSFFVFPLQ